MDKRWKDVAADQPPPQPGGVVVLDEAIRYVELMGWPGLADDLHARAEMGKDRYGTLLMTHNGRDAVMDCYQECLDALMYITQAKLELPAEESQQLLTARTYLFVATKCLKEFIGRRD